MPNKFFLVPFAATLLTAQAPPPPPGWLQKPIAQWNENDAKQVLADSPWVKTTHLENIPDLSPFARRDGGDMDAGVGKGVGIAGTGILGPTRAREAIARAHEKPDLGNALIRWESALPVHAAEMKVVDEDAPPPPWQTRYYAIAVYNIPVPPHWRSSGLKGLALLRRYQKKDFKPYRVDILSHEDDRVSAVYYFSRSEEITKKDVSVLFQAQIGRVFITEVFYIEDMNFEGNLEL